MRFLMTQYNSTRGEWPLDCASVCLQWVHTLTHYTHNTPSLAILWEVLHFLRLHAVWSEGTGPGAVLWMVEWVEGIADRRHSRQWHIYNREKQLMNTKCHYRNVSRLISIRIKTTSESELDLSQSDHDRKNVVLLRTAFNSTHSLLHT